MRQGRRVAVLHGAVPPDAPADEQDVLVQVEAVSAALRRLGHQPTALPLDLDLAAAQAQLADLRPDLVLNLVESIAGSGRLAPLAPALLEALRLPYTGSRLSAFFNSSDKLTSKSLLAAAGLPVPAAWRPGDPAPTVGRWILKSVWEHASVGLDDASVTAEPATLPALAAERAEHLGGECFAERYISGRELNLALLADSGGTLTPLPPAEIEFRDFPANKPHIVGYRAKWDVDSFEYHNTVRRFDFGLADGRLLAELERLAIAACSVFKASGYARVDFRVDAQGQPWILELNANPCLSPDAGFAAAAAHAGLSYDETIDRILSAARIHRWP